MKNLLPLITALSLTACAATAPTTQPTAPTAAPASPTPTPAIMSVGELTPTNSTWTDDGYCTGDAYYEVARGDRYGAPGLLLKTDYATGIQAPWCTVPGCDHQTESCPARVDCPINVNIVAVQPNAVWLVYLPYAEADRADYAGGLAGMQARAEENGDAGYRDYLQGLTPEERAAEENKVQHYASPGYWLVLHPDAAPETLPLPPELNALNSIFRWCDGTALYGQSFQTESDPGDELLRLELGADTVTRLPLLSGEAPVAAQGSRFLTERMIFDAPLPDSGSEAYRAALQTAQYEYSWLDPATGQRTPVLTLDDAQGRTVTQELERLYQGRLYYNRTEWANSEQKSLALYCYDPATGETTTVMEDAPAQDALFDDDTRLICSDNAWPYLELFTQNGDHRWELNLDTGALQPIPQALRRDDLTYPVRLQALTADGRLLVGYRDHNGNAETYRYDYGLISPEDYLAGSEDYQLVQMWEG